MTIRKTPYHSYRCGRLAKGCRMCVRGEKLVLFIGGICNRACFYCPLSDQKRQKDVIYANEWPAGKAGKHLSKKQKEIIIAEARLCDAKGAGITGGDPLLVNERAVDAIRLLKKAFGKGFHIHLYTTLENITKEKIAALHAAGLDEIRLHPTIWNSRLWHKIALGKAHPWDVGVEIPAIPGYEEHTKKLIDCLDGRIGFLNLNELEISDTNANHLVERGFLPKDGVSYGVRGSERLAKKLLRHIDRKGYRYSVHYCTCTLKDRVQMAERLKRRAKNARLPTDEVTGEGMLVRGALYLPELFPSFGYRRKIASLTAVQKRDLMRKLKEAKRRLLRALGGSLFVDEDKYRLLTSASIVKKGKNSIKHHGLLPAVVTEYPTADALEIDVHLL